MTIGKFDVNHLGKLYDNGSVWNAIEVIKYDNSNKCLGRKVYQFSFEPMFSSEWELGQLYNLKSGSRITRGITYKVE